jgi:hypothetical protein
MVLATLAASSDALRVRAPSGKQGCDRNPFFLSLREVIHTYTHPLLFVDSNTQWTT